MPRTGYIQESNAGPRKERAGPESFSFSLLVRRFKRQYNRNGRS